MFTPKHNMQIEIREIRKLNLKKVMNNSFERKKVGRRPKNSIKEQHSYEQNSETLIRKWAKMVMLL